MLRTSWRLFLRTKRVFFPALLAGVGTVGFAFYSGACSASTGTCCGLPGTCSKPAAPCSSWSCTSPMNFSPASGKAAWRRRPRPSPGGRPGSTPRPGRSSSAWRLYSF